MATALMMVPPEKPESLSIFAVDDDADVLRSVAVLLQLRGYSVTCFDSAEAFLAKVSNEQAGCLITDLHMPGMRGEELLRHVRRHFQKMAVVVVTGAADVGVAVSVMEDGAVTLLEKPYSPDALVKAIERALDKSAELAHQYAEVERIIAKLKLLSDEEFLVMECMVTDMPNKQVVSELELSPRTVDRRRDAVKTKMGVDSIPQLAVLLSLVPPEVLAALRPPVPRPSSS